MYRNYNSHSDIAVVVYNVLVISVISKLSYVTRIDCYLLYVFVLTAVGLTPGGSSTVHIYTQTVHRIQRTEDT
jgi:hypothetical protein